MAHWTDRWIGLRYAEHGRGPDAYDCLGLYLAVSGLPDTSMRAAVRQRDRRMREVSSAAKGDALLFRGIETNLHVGFALDDRDMLHIDRAGSRVEKWTGLQWHPRLIGFYRFA